MKILNITPSFVDTIPDHLEEGVLYICERYKTVVHKCCCGCGEEVVTPLSPADWSLRKRGDRVSLDPSIGNWSYNCKSHYWIMNNRVVWGERFSQRQIDIVKAKDNADKKAYIEAVNREKDASKGLLPLLGKCWNLVTSWWESLSK